MPLSFTDFVKLLISQMTENERREGKAYAAEELLPAGSRTQFNKTSVEVSEDSYIGFIDRDPQANWGHSARYVIVNQKKANISSLEARLPPFGSGSHTWRLVYTAPGILGINPKHTT